MTLSLPSGSSRLAAIAAAVWVVQPFTSGTVIGEALSVTADPFRSLVSAGAWALWLVVLLALAFPHPVSLTVARIGAVGGVMASVWAAVEAPSSTGSGLVTIGVLASAAAFVTINLPGLGDRFVDGVSYGDEQRFLLRAPGPALFTLIGPAAMIVVLGASVGPLLLADQQWIAGAIATVVGFAIAVVPFMALHRLTSRFLVFVPNGLVVHDRTQLREPVLFVTREIALGPAPADTIARDITARFRIPAARVCCSRTERDGCAVRCAIKAWPKRTSTPTCRASTTRRHIGSGLSRRRRRPSGVFMSSSSSSFDRPNDHEGNIDVAAVWFQLVGIMSIATSMPSARVHSIISSVLRMACSGRPYFGLM